jgi:tRNA modification GTPase
MRKLFASDGSLLDEALTLYFQEPASFTGENIVEFQVHGSISVVDRLLAQLETLDGFRLAEPGEFTRRALLNGKLDLAQVEGLADLIDAETEMQRVHAQRLFSGSLGNKREEWRSQFIRALALLEVTIDFVDEDVPEDLAADVLEILDQLIAEFRREISGTEVAERVREGFEVAIVGPPNVGKSTLLNTICGRDAAITSSTAGTTRDIIEVRMDLNGLLVTFLDTAGIRESSDDVEKIGIRRAVERSRAADLRIFLTEDGLVPTSEERSVDDFVLLGKADEGSQCFRGVSGKTGFGVDDLLGDIGRVLMNRVSSIGTASKRRHSVALEKSVEHLVRAVDLIRRGGDYADIAAEEIRNALSFVDTLVGRVGVEVVLDEVFSSFCLGK